MNREEKNQQTRRRIMDNALAEFSKRGYGASSVNTICAGKDISKGIIYHYFKTKDELYLACVEECFQRLTDHLRSALTPEQETVEGQLEQYFSARVNFFQKYPIYQAIFCEAVISPPGHLLRLLPLRPHLTIDEVIEMVREYQDFINAKYQVSLLSAEEFQRRDVTCRKALNILLYGVIERRNN